MRRIAILWRGKSEFDRIFLLREFTELAGGVRWRTVWQLAMIIFITLAALAFGEGSLKRLAKRMDSPFSTIVDLDIPPQDYHKVNALSVNLLKPDRRHQSGIDTMTTWYRFTIPFFGKGKAVSGELDATIGGTGRTIDFSSKLFEGVFVADNIIRNLIITEDRQEINERPEAGVVVTEDFLLSLGYSAGEIDKITLLGAYDLNIGDNYFLPILAIVEKLPSQCDFLTSLTFYKNVFIPGCAATNPPFTGNDKAKNNVYFITATVDAEATLRELQESYPAGKLRSAESAPLSPTGVPDITRLRLIFDHGFIASQPNYLQELSKELDTLNPGGWAFYNALNVKTQNCQEKTPQHLAFLFKDLSKITAFNDYLWKKYQLKFPLEEVKNRQNFALVSALAYLMGTMLLLFALVSICLFMRSLIVNHLNKVKSNLGTFKAFGLADQQLRANYGTLLLVLLTVATGVGFGAAILLDLVFMLAGQADYLDLFTPRIFVALLIVFLLSFLTSRHFIRTLLFHSPGDLIYGRDTV